MTKEEYRNTILSGAKDTDIYPLYAITNNKEYAKRFQEERNMDKFILIKKKDDRESCVDFMNRRRLLVLELHEYRYYPHIEDNDPDSNVIKILSTGMEKQRVDSCTDSVMIDFPIGVSFSTNPFVFKDKYLSALRTLEYDTLYKLSCAELSFHSVPDDEGFPEPPDILFDELQMFLYLYSKYFK